MLKKLLSYFFQNIVFSVSSNINDKLEVCYVNGKYVLDSKNTNYSYGNLQKVLEKGLNIIGKTKISNFQNTLLLGVGAGCVIETLTQKFNYKYKIIGVELDEKVIEIAEKCTIVNGVIQAELIMTNDRNIVFKDEYEAVVNEFEKQEALKAKTKEKNLQKKVTSSEQVPGKIYTDIKNNSEYCYLGSATVDSAVKHIYISASQVQDIYETSKYDYNYSKTNKKHAVELKHPKILNAWSKRFYSEREYDNLAAVAKNDLDWFNFYDSYYLRITSTKLSMSESSNNRNIYDSYTEEDWEMVNLAYDKDFRYQNKTNRNKEYTLKGQTSVNHFREDYLKFKI